MSKRDKQIENNKEAFSNNILRIVGSNSNLTADFTMRKLACTLIGKSTGNEGDFTITYDSANTITLGTLNNGNSVYIADIEGIAVLDSNGNLTEELNKSALSLSLSGSTLTVSGFRNDFNSDDEFVIYTNIPRNNLAISGNDGSSNQTLTTNSDGKLLTIADIILATGNNLIGSSDGTNPDFTVTYAGSNTLTIGNYPNGSTLNVSDIVFIRVQNSIGNHVETLSIQDLTLSISGSTLTITGFSNDFESDDVFIIGTNVRAKDAFDSGLDNIKTNRQNPEYEHYTSVIHLVDETNLDADTYRYIINMESYKNLSLHLKGSGGVTFTVWASNDDTADDSADAGWVDISSDVLGGASITDDEGIYFIDTSYIPERLMIKVVTSDATNAVDIWYKKA